MKFSIRQIPTWLLLMPSVAVGAAIVGMDATARDEALQQQKSEENAWLQVALTGQETAPKPKPAPAKFVRANNGRALYEPARGAYLGVAVDAAASNGDPKLLTQSMREWNTQSGRKHALQLGFVQFPGEDGSFPGWDSDPRGWLAPSAFAQGATDAGAAPVLTLEPFKNPLQFSQGWKPGTKAYEATKVFAQGAGKWGKPLFIRWAHEMNGSWYPWAEWTDKNQNMRRDPGEDTGFTPRDYRLAYRNVAALFRQYAPNAALVWCPNAGLLGGERRDVFRPWYPGDDVVDWVSLDIYERGWTMPMPGAKLWGGQYAHNLTHDMADNPNTPQNESVDFYKTFAVGKKKPMMIGETSATLSYRTDLEATQRGLMNNEWKSGYWNDAEYGWLQSVYGTQSYIRQSGRKLLHPIDRDYPMVKAIIWFQIAKPEWIPVQKTVGNRTEMVWYNNTYTDYRVGGGIVPEGEKPFGEQELDLYRELTQSNYFLSAIQN